MSFLYPLFLAGLAALAVPIVLHLMHRPMPRRVVFPSIRFILKGQQFQSGKKGLRDIFTLLARLFVLALIVLIFARPSLPNQPVGTTPAGEQVPHLALLVDLSASMNAVDFQRDVRDRIAALLSENPTARVALLASSDRVTAEIGFTADHRQILRTVEELRPTIFPGNHRELREKLRHLLDGAAGAPVRVHLFSDLQRTDWASIDLLPPGSTAEVVFARPWEQAPGNLAILGVTPQLFVTEESRQLRASVTVHNYGIRQAHAVLRLTAGSSAVQIPVEIDSGATRKVVVDLPAPESDICVARLDSDDPYELDDRYHFWIGRSPPTRVAIVVPGEGNEQALAAYFLSQALATTAPGAAQFQVELKDNSFIYEPDLAKFQAIFWLDSFSDYTEIEMEELGLYLKNGGVSVYLAGPNAPTALPLLNRAGLTDTRFLRFAGDEAQLTTFFVTDWDKSSPILAPFLRQTADLLVFPIYRLAELQPPTGANVLLQADRSLPVLIEQRVGQGRLYLLATGLGAAWSELPTSMCFVPLTRRLAAAGLGDDQRRVIRLEVGEDATGKLVAAGLKPRQFDAEAGVALAEGVPVEINHTRAESDLRPADTFELLYAPGGNAAGQAMASTNRQADPGGRPLRGYLALALIVLLGLEILLANWRLT